MQETHFIRCIKPNDAGIKEVFEDEFVLQQLKSSSFLAYVNLIRSGYPKRIHIDQIYKAFKQNHHLWRDDCMDSKRFCSNLLLSNGCDSTDFKFGTDCIFFRTKCSVLLQNILKSHPEFITQSMKRMKRYLIRLEWKNAYKKALLAGIFPCICIILEHYLSLSRRKHKKRRSHW